MVGMCVPIFVLLIFSDFSEKNKKRTNEYKEEEKIKRIVKIGGGN